MPILGSIRERWLYRKGLMLADCIITQTAQQQLMLKQGFGLASTPLSMPSDVSSSLSPAELTNQRTGRLNVLWVGRMMPVKRPEMILDIAAQLPEITFHVVGGTDQDAAYNDSIMTRAAGLSNVIMHGRMSRSDVFRLYRSCHALTCTSEYEGFPNTFLEAFAHGLPVISTVDPDGIIERKSLGSHCTTAQEFIDTLRAMSRHTDRLKALGENAWRYYYCTHHLDAAMPRFEALLTRIGEST
jgi:glycosyltransferase involved in cell wall biosynthesis